MPYLETYRLHDYYDDIVVGDVPHTDLPPCDVVSLGDVVEHVTRDEGIGERWRGSEVGVFERLTG